MMSEEKVVTFTAKAAAMNEIMENLIFIHFHHAPNDRILRESSPRLFDHI